MSHYYRDITLLGAPTAKPKRMSGSANDETLLRTKNDVFRDDVAVHGVYIPKGAPTSSAGISDC
jgi:hypothetical protein